MFNHWLDRITESSVRNSARRGSRRSFLSTLGLGLIGVGGLVVLPLYRASAFAQTRALEEGDPNSCDYWRHCAIDGYLCGCCGGSVTTCPPGTVASDITWIGTCHNPTDGRDYIISYNDCCGQSTCGRCSCQRDEGDTPIYRPQTANNLNWCSGSKADVPYVCSLSVVIGVKDKA